MIRAHRHPMVALSPAAVFSPAAFLKKRIQSPHYMFVVYRKEEAMETLCRDVPTKKIVISTHSAQEYLYIVT